MMNSVSVNYIKIIELNEHGDVRDKTFALHIFDKSKETIVEHTSDFQELTNKVKLSNLIEYLQAFFSEYFEVILETKYLYFNGVSHQLCELGYDAKGNKVA